MFRFASRTGDGTTVLTGRSRTSRTPRTAAAVAACTVALGLSLGGGAAQAAAPAAPAPHAAHGTRAGAADSAAQRHTAAEIHRFLTWFYDDHGPTDWQRQHSVSDHLKEKQQQNPQQDVLLCAQNTPQHISVGPVTTAQSAGYGWATVTAHWQGGGTSRFTAYVALDSHPIELYDVDCSA